MKIFGNPNIKKSQSFNTFKPQKIEQSPDCPKNSPLESLSSTPITSPKINHKNIFSTNGKSNLEKSQSFSVKLPPIEDENLSTNQLKLTLTKPTRRKLVVTQPEIILTSPMDSPKTE